MGTDIHFYVETKDESGAWHRAEPLVPNQWHGRWEGEPEQVRDAFYNGRNYSLFAMLAAVRNGRGFAGVDIGDRVTPIADPRGIPEDVSDEVRAAYQEWDCDGHSHSYFTLAELLATDWHGNRITHRGWVGPKEFERWDKWGTKPRGSCGSVSGGRVQHLSNEGLRGRIERKEATDYDYTQISWSESWAEAAEPFMSTLVRMARYAPDNDTRRIRAVFWFDN